MSTSYFNKFYDFYIKQKGTTGAITDSSGNTYSFRNDGNTYLNGSLNVAGSINSITSTIFNYIANLTSDAQGQLNSLSSSISTINTTLTGMSYSGATLMQTIIPNINSTKYYLSGVQLSNIGNTQWLDISSSLTSQLGTKTTLTAVQSNNNVFTGTNSFNSSLPTSTITPTISGQLITKNYGDSTYATITNLTSANSNITTNTTNIINLQTLLSGVSWDGTYYYNNFSNNVHVFGTLKIANLSNDVASTFSNIYSTLSTLTTLSAVQSNNNVFTGTTSFNSSLPTSILNPSSSSQLITKNYSDSTYATITNLSSAISNITNLQSILSGVSWDGTYYYNNFSYNVHVYGVLNLANLSNDVASTFSNIYSTLSTLTTLSAVQSNNNSWTGTNAFNTSLPTSSLTPYSSSQLITKAYADANYTASGGTTLSAIQNNNNSWTGTNAFNTSLPTSSLTPSTSSQLITKAYCDTQVATKQNLLNSTTTNAISCLSLSVPTISLNGSDLTTSLNGKQPTLTSSSVILCNTINGNSLSNLTNLQYLDINSSLTTQLASKQPNIISTTNLSLGNLQLNTISNTTPIIQMYGYGGSGSSVSINLDTYYGRSGGPASIIKAIDNGNASNDIVFYTATSGSASTVTSERMRIYSNGVLNVGANQVLNKQLALYDTNSSDTPSSATAFYGFGVNSHVMRYQVDSTSSGHKFYGGTTNYVSIDNTGITVNNGVLNSNNVTAYGSNNLSLNAPSSQVINFNINNSTYAYLSATTFSVTNVSISGSFNLIPPGTIIMNVSSSAILGYFVCDGSSYPTSTYYSLFNAISYNFGGSGSSFNVPDFRGAFLRGYGTNGSYSSYTGSSIGSVQTDTIASHSHTISPPNANYQYGNNSGSYGSTTGTKSVTTTGNYSSCPTSTNSSGSTETRPFNYSVYYFIKW